MKTSRKSLSHQTIARPGRTRGETVWLVVAAGGVVGVSVALATIPTTVNDFFMAGTQPNTILEPITDANDCMACHGDYDRVKEPFRPWAASMMGQSARDPVFYAALAIANQDAAFAGEFCLRCHVPGAWLAGRSADPTGGTLFGADFQGVSCNLCHRMVDPTNGPGAPAIDAAILAEIDPLPPNPHNANYIVDPLDRRRGPYDLGPNFFFHDWAQANYQSTSQMCATCHDVSTPVFTRQPDGTYALNDLNTPHPTGSKFDMFPEQRTYSEWAQSQFAQGPVDVGGRFGGTLPAVSSCQDCHMPQTSGQSCRVGNPPVRHELSQHHFNGGNTWVLKAIRATYPDEETFLSAQTVQDSIDRAVSMLQNASDMQLSVVASGPGQDVNVRIINWSGHKLPTGYNEGRRMWINVRFLDAQNNVVAERGAYDFNTATLTENDTKVYEGKIGPDAAVAAVTGVPAGPGFHLAISNTWFKDNRIPPKGFTNAGFAAVQAAPVAYTYADGQHWDDTRYAVPPGATSAQVTVYYQTTTKEYIEFLRDANTTNMAGQHAYDLWVQFGKSAPVVMDQATIPIPTACYPNCDGSTIIPVLNALDFACFLNRYRAGETYANCDGSTIVPTLNALDFACFLNSYRAGCP